jgi:hypothetical protein
MAQMPASTRSLRPRPYARVTPTVVVLLLLMAVGPARADIAIESVDRTSGAPGDRVDLLIACGGCLPRAVKLPVSLLPIGDSPAHHPCRGASCASRAPAPPESAPFVPLGTAVPLHGGVRLASRLGLDIPPAVGRHGRGAIRDWVASINRLRFRVPDAEPGLYTYVIYCGRCLDGQGGTLIGHPEPEPARNRARLTLARKQGQFLQIEPATTRADESGGRASSLWWVISALVLIVLFVAWRRRSRRPPGALSA